MSSEITLNEDDIWRVLRWCAATDFEAKTEPEDLPLVTRLCKETGEDVDTYLGVMLSVQGAHEQG